MYFLSRETSLPYMCARIFIMLLLFNISNVTCYLAIEAKCTMTRRYSRIIAVVIRYSHSYVIKAENYRREAKERKQARNV